jgi:hypothetical protein
VTKNNGFYVQITLILVPIIIGGDIGVDKWSNHMRSNFFIFSVDK